MKRLVGTILCCLWACATVFAVGKSGSIVYISGEKYYVHTVQPGETLYALAKEYGVNEQVIVRHNPTAAAGLKAGENLKIPYISEQGTTALSEKKLRKAFDQHKIVKGETLYGISRLYGIDIPTLLADNPGLDPIHLKLDENILIRKKQIGSVSEQEAKAQWEEYRNSLNSVAEAGQAYHIVQPGETFYSLSRQMGITEEELSKLNNGLKPADLKSGAMIRIPGEGKTLAETTEPNPETITEQPTETEIGKSITFKSLLPQETLRVAILLPLATGSGSNDNFTEFYQGFLLGLDSVRTHHGYNIDVTLFNTGRDVESVRRITETAEFRRSNLIVGPVYEEVLQPVIDFAEEHSVPVVSPLANVTNIQSETLFQLAPDPASKYQKVSNLTDGSRRVTLIYGSGNDKEFEQEILAQLGHTPYNRHTYKYQHPSTHRGTGGAGDLTSLLQGDGEKLFVVMADNEVEVERILAALASAYTNLTSRGSQTANFTVLGNARWNRYNNIDRTMFFKNRVVFLSTYHAKRDNETISEFDSNYIRAFGALPTLYSYRGYDAALIFAAGSYADIETNMEGSSYTPLQTTYIFEQGTGRKNHVNRNWTRVNYNNDFTITLE